MRVSGYGEMRTGLFLGVRWAVRRPQLHSSLSTERIEFVLQQNDGWRSQEPLGSLTNHTMLLENAEESTTDHYWNITVLDKILTDEC